MCLEVFFVGRDTAGLLLETGSSAKEWTPGLPPQSSLNLLGSWARQFFILTALAPCPHFLSHVFWISQINNLDLNPYLRTCFSGGHALRQAGSKVIKSSQNFKIIFQNGIYALFYWVSSCAARGGFLSSFRCSVSRFRVFSLKRKSKRSLIASVSILIFLSVSLINPQLSHPALCLHADDWCHFCGQTSWFRHRAGSFHYFHFPWIPSLYLDWNLKRHLFLWKRNPILMGW